MSRCVVVATDASGSAAGALRVARELESAHGRSVRVVAVVEPVPVFDTGLEVGLPRPDLALARQQGLEAEVLEELERVLGERPEWPVETLHGTPGPSIARAARSASAEAILVGLGRHGLIDRITGAETALSVIHSAPQPVLTVPAGCGALSGAAVVGVDFSDLSLAAARHAASFLNRPAVVHLAHVLGGVESLPDISEAWQEDAERQARERLEELAEKLDLGGDLEIRLHVLEGSVTRALLDLATDVGAELICAGSHGRSFVHRLLLGSVTTRLVRASAVSVLVVPPAGGEAEEEVAESSGRRPEADEWIQLLREFTERNAGRLCTVEVSDPELGVQRSGVDLPLLGVDYDPRRDRVELMLGPMGTVEGHLTHSLPGPESVELDRVDTGDRALRVGLTGGSVILTVHRT